MTETRSSDRTAGRRLERLAMLFGAFLAVSWLVPDIASGDPVFPLGGLGFMEPSVKAASLACPVAGALVMIALLVPAARRIAPWSAVFICSAALAVSTVLREPALPLSGGMALALTSAGCALSTVLLRMRPDRTLIGHLASAAFPLALVLFSLAGVLAGEQSPAFLAPYREAACLWALAAAISCCAASLPGGFVR